MDRREVDQRSARLRVLVSAYACEPDRGSEPGIGWNVVRELAREYEVTVLTRDNNRSRIEGADWTGRIAPEFEYHDLPASMRRWKRGPWTTELYYQLWQASARNVVRRLHDQNAFDVAQHITFGRYWVPTPLAALEVPLVLGPVGGGDSVPIQLRGSLGTRGRVVNTVRESVRWSAERRPSVLHSLASSCIALGATPATARRMAELGARRVAVEPAVGLPDEEIEQLGAIASASNVPPTFVSAGRLVAWKGYEFGLRAFALVAGRRADVRYMLIGEGPERGRLERLARDLGVSGRVEFSGSLSRPDTLRAIGSSVALVHPSMLDSGGWVCLEAMAMSRPVLCLDLAGPAVLVPSEAGVLIAADDERGIIERLSVAMIELAGNSEKARVMGAAGRRHVATNLAWSRRGAVLRSVLREAAGRTDG